MTALIAVLVDCDPVRMRVINILMTRVRVSSRHHVHAEFAAGCGDFSKGIAITEPFAAVMQRDLGWIKSDASAGVKQRCLRVTLLEVIEPERKVVISGIVFDETQLGPAHRPIVPAVPRHVRLLSIIGQHGCFHSGRAFEANRVCGREPCSVLEKCPSRTLHALALSKPFTQSGLCRPPLRCWRPAQRLWTT